MTDQEPLPDPSASGSVRLGGGAEVQTLPQCGHRCQSMVPALGDSNEIRPQRGQTAGMRSACTAMQAPHALTLCDPSATLTPS